jgi:hypothetical protein
VGGGLLFLFFLLGIFHGHEGGFGFLHNFPRWLTTVIVKMSHSGHGSGGVVVPADPYFAKIYWIFVGGVIAAGVLVHGGEVLLYRQRLVFFFFYLIQASLLSALAVLKGVHPGYQRLPPVPRTS